MKVDEYEILRNNLSTLKETSIDNSGDQPEYMTDCIKEVVNFDKMKRSYMNALGKSEDLASSVDSFLIENNNYLIEFKNGDIRKDKPQIVSKVKDSLLILNDILKRQISESRKTDIFVLVYNKDKMGHKNMLAKCKAEKAKERFSIAGLEKMKDFCFLDVLTLDKREFQKQIVEKLGW